MSLLNLPEELHQLIARSTNKEIAQNFQKDTAAIIIPFLENAIKHADKNMTVFLWSAKNGYTGLVKALFDNGADISACNPTENSKTALHYAAEGGHDEVVTALLDMGFDVDKQTTHGWTALHCAVKCGHEKVASILIKHGGANMDKKTKYGANTALHFAVAEGRFSVISVLVEQGADLNSKDYNGATAFHYAVLDHDAKVRHFSSVPGFRASDFRVRSSDRLATVKLFLEEGASTEITDNYNKKVVDYISARDTSTIRQMFGNNATQDKTRALTLRNIQKLAEVKQKQENIKLQRQHYKQIQRWTVKDIRVIKLREYEDDEDECEYEGEGYGGIDSEGEGEGGDSESKFESGGGKDNISQEKVQKAVKGVFTFPFSAVWLCLFATAFGVYLRSIWPEARRY